METDSPRDAKRKNKSDWKSKQGILDWISDGVRCGEYEQNPLALISQLNFDINLFKPWVVIRGPMMTKAYYPVGRC